MDANEQLETFRRQWKNEILSKKPSQSSIMDKSHGKGSSPSSTGSTSSDKTASVEILLKVPSTENKIVSQNENGLDITLPSVSNVNEQQPSRSWGIKASSVYRPFSIVGDLLNDQEVKCFKRKPDVLVKEQISRTMCKNKGISSGLSDSQKYKRLKLTKLKDIFVNKVQSELPQERLLDKLISDIDEITEIPFFDINLPRELAVKIFQYLDMKELCRCAQVSKSWGSLAEDELLWCKICHGLGQEKIYTTKEKTNWKQIVRHNVERQKTLTINWKTRTGKLTNLEHVKGKILTSAYSEGQTIVAGYTNGEVKLWDLEAGDNCVFQPSSTSLRIDDNLDYSQSNMVETVITAGGTTAAVYMQGNIDIWQLESGTQPVQTLTLPADTRALPTVCLSHTGDALISSYQRFIDVHSRNSKDSEFTKVHQLEADSDVKLLKLYPSDCDIPSVIYSLANSVRVYYLHPTGSRYSGETTEVHNLFGANVDAIDTRVSQSQLGVALGPESWGGTGCGLKVRLYDIKSCKLLQMFSGHSWKVTCMNLKDSPENELVTGSLDKQVRVFDIRSCDCVQSFYHRLPMYQVQMDEWKVVAGGEDGFVQVWDRRTGNKLWELYNRHPVRYLRFEDKYLTVCNISKSRQPDVDEYETATHRKYRGSISVYNFLEDLTTKDVPEICLSTYDQPDASMYNISLAVPYDTLNF